MAELRLPQYSLDSSLGFFDFCARAAPSLTVRLQGLLDLSLLKSDHDDVCNDAKNATFDLGACYDALDDYYDDVTKSDGKILTTIKELAEAHEAGRASCHGNEDYSTKVASLVSSRITAATAAGDLASIPAIPAQAAADVAADFLKCSALQAVPLGAVMEEPKSSKIADITSTRFLMLSFFLGGRHAEIKDAYLISQWQRAWVEMMLAETTGDDAKTPPHPPKSTSSCAPTLR